MSHSQGVPTEHEHHIDYVRIWYFLVAALLASLLLAHLNQKALAVTLIFGVAIAKALAVLGYYMHLKLEPKWVAVVIVCGFLVLGILFVGLIPDIVRVGSRL